MDTSNYQGGTGGGESTVESVDWRTQWPADSRQKLVNKIIETLEKYYSFLGPEKLHEITSFAPRLEDKIFKTATTHDDYMRKISMKLLTVETKSANLMPNTLQSNSTGSSVNPSDPGSHGMHQGQPLPVPVPSNHPQVSASVSSILPSANGLPQPTISNISTQNPSFHNIQNMSGVQVQQNSVGINMGQGIPSNSYVNPRQMPGRQQQPQQQTQQQSQNLQQCHYRQHLNQIAKQSLQQSYSATSAQSHIQQQHQNLLQPGHFQPSSLSALQQNQQPVIQHHQQSALRHQRQQPQASLAHHHHHHHHHHQQQQPQSNPMGQQTSASYSDMQQPPPRLLSQQNNLSNVHQPHQHSVGQHNNFSAMHQQHLGPQSSSQLLGTQSGNSSMLSNKHSAHMMMQTKVSIPQQNQSMQGQQRSQPELQQQVMPQLQTQSGQLQHHLNMKPQPNMSQRDMQQRIPTSGGSQQQNVIDQQKQLFQQQRPMPEASSTSSDSTAQTGNPNSGDWQEEVYQKVKAMKDKYLPELTDLHQKIIGKLQQHDSLPQQAKNEQLEKMKKLKHICEICIQVLQVPKSNISPSFKDNLSQHEKQIINIITTCNRKPGPTHLQQPQPHMPQLHPHETHINSPNSMLQHQQLKLHIHRQQFLQKQQLLQHQQQQQNQQQFNRNSKQQLQPIQLPHIGGVKMESSLQRSQLKSGPPFSPQIPSPNIDQQNLMNSATTKSSTCTPLQSANSPFTMSSPSTPSTSHAVGDSEKVNSGISSLSNAGNAGHQSNAAMLPTQLLPFGTPGISASPLLAEFATPHENHGNNASVVSEKSTTIEQPIEHLLKVVKSISAKSLSASVSDIGSVVSMIDSIAGSGTCNNNKASTSRAAVGEDLVATTKCRLLQGKSKMKRLTTAMPLNLVSSANSVNDSFKHWNGFDASELESTATSTVKRPRIETSNALLEEIRGINRGLIDTMVDIDADSEVGKGTVVKCSFGAVNVSPIQPLRLLIPASYPTCSPILLDKSPLEVSVSKEYEDLSVKAKWRFCNYVRMFSERMSLEEMATAWDVCAREVVSKYAQQTGGGTFTSKYGAWEDCLTSTVA